MKVQLTCHPIVLMRFGDAIKKKEMEVIQIVAKIAAKKYQADLIRSPLDEPKKTIAPERNVNTDTVANNITINCTGPPFN